MTAQNSFFSTDARHQRPFSSAAQLPLRSMSASRPSVIPPGLDHDSSQTPVFDVTQRLFLPDISQRLTAARPSVAALCFHIRPICSSIQRQQQTKAVEMQKLWSQQQINFPAFQLFHRTLQEVERYHRGSLMRNRNEDSSEYRRYRTNVTGQQNSEVVNDPWNVQTCSVETKSNLCHHIKEQTFSEIWV